MKLAKATKRAVDGIKKAKVMYDRISEPLENVIKVARGQVDDNEGSENTGTNVDTAREIMKAAGMVDPTGVISAAAAYTYPLCAHVPGIADEEVDAGKCDCKHEGSTSKDCGRAFTGEADGFRSHCTSQLSELGCEGRKNVWGQNFCSWTPDTEYEISLLEELKEAELEAGKKFDLHGWMAIYAESRNKYYYYNTYTHETTWIRPTEPHKMPEETPLPEGWEQFEDSDTGYTFYFNRKTGESTWTRPH